MSIWQSSFRLGSILLSKRAFPLPDNIFRSGVPHAVETNLVTRNAVNPRHAFSENDQAADHAQTDGADSPTLNPRSRNETDAPVVAGEHLTDNIQALDKVNLTDNWQSLGKAHVQDNLQDVDMDAFNDNRQSLGPSQSIQDNKLYLEKKSIKDNRQKVVSGNVQRAAPQLPKDVAAALPSQSHAPQTPLPSSSSLTPNSAAGSTPKTTEEDELRARMKKLKATVRDVNHTLSDLDPKP